MLCLITLMLFLAAYNLSGAELRDISALTFLGDMGLAPLLFTAHSYARIAVFGFLLVGAMALLYGVEIAKPREQVAALFALAGAVGVVFSGNFITLFLFWELLTFSTAVLIILKGTPQAVRRGYHFLLFHFFGGLCMLLGILQQYAATGSFDLVVPEAGLPFFVLAVGFKTAFLPFHVWIAWGYPAASFFASVVLVGLTTKIGVYAFARFVPSDTGIALMGASMAILGVTCALLQKDMRRLLSYLLIVQVGYMVAGIATGSSLGVDGGLLHLVNHMVYKGLLFMSAGVLIFTLGTENIQELSNIEKKEATSPIWKSMPLATMGAVVGACACIGLPLFNGYVSKYLLKGATYGISPVEGMLLVAGVGTVLAFCKLIYFGFIKGRAITKKKLPITMQLAIVTMIFLCLLFGVRPQLLANLLPYTSSLAVYSTKGILTALQFFAIGVMIFIMLGKILAKDLPVPVWLSVEYLLYAPLGRLVLAACRYASIMDRYIDHFYGQSGKAVHGMAQNIHRFDGVITEMQEKVGSSVYRIAKKMNQLNGAISELKNVFGSSTHKEAQVTHRLESSMADLHEALSNKDTIDFPTKYDSLPERVRQEMASDKEKKGPSLWQKLQWQPEEINIRNINFSSLIVVVIMGTFLFLLAYYVDFF